MAARKRKSMKVEKVTRWLCVTGSGIKPDELNAEINRLITKDGFQPWGSPHWGDQGLLSQVMVKKEIADSD